MAAPEVFLADASIIFKWLHADGERLLVEAEALLTAHAEGSSRALTLDLAFYEVGSALVSRRDLSIAAVGDALDVLRRLELVLLDVGRTAGRRAAELARAHRLSFYDAAYLASALELGVPLVTDDRPLLAAAQAEGVGMALEDV